MWSTRPAKTAAKSQKSKGQLAQTCPIHLAQHSALHSRTAEVSLAPACPRSFTAEAFASLPVWKWQQRLSLIVCKQAQFSKSESICGDQSPLELPGHCQQLAGCLPLGKSKCYHSAAIPSETLGCNRNQLLCARIWDSSSKIATIR